MTRLTVVALIAFAHVAGASEIALAQSAPAPITTAPAGAIGAGTPVIGTGGAEIGTIEAVEDNLATVNAGTARVRIPTDSFALQDGKAMIGMTRDAFMTATAGIAQPVEAPPLTGDAALAKLKIGLPVFGKNGERIGNIQQIDGDFATVSIDGGVLVRVPLNSFAVNDVGALVGVTKAEFAAIATGG